MLVSKDVCRPAVLRPYTSRKYNWTNNRQYFNFQKFQSKFLYCTHNTSWYVFIWM